VTAHQTNPVTFVLIFRIPTEGVEDFRAYEEAVLPLLPEFNGRLERRLRNPDGTVEMHIVATHPMRTVRIIGMIPGTRRKPGCWKNHLPSWNCSRWRTSLNGTRPLSRDVRDYGEYWRVSGLHADIEIRF
jgi:hypothetical protein